MAIFLEFGAVARAFAALFAARRQRRYGFWLPRSRARFQRRQARREALASRSVASRSRPVLPRKAFSSTGPVMPSTAAVVERWWKVQRLHGAGVLGQSASW